MFFVAFDDFRNSKLTTNDTFSLQEKRTENRILRGPEAYQRFETIPSTL